MHYKNYLFRLNEEINDKTKNAIGELWWDHHARKPGLRFSHRAEENRREALNNPFYRKGIERGKELYRQRDALALHDDPDNPLFVTGYKDPEKAEVLYKRARRLTGRAFEDKVGMYLGKKAGYEAFPGEPGENFPGSIFNVDEGIRTMHQRAGERSSAAAGRLWDYLNRNGINQENPTAQDRQNYQNWLNRTGGSLLNIESRKMKRNLKLYHKRPSLFRR